MLNYLGALLNLHVRDERGASAVEYGLLVAGIAAVMVGAVFLFGDALAHLFDGSCDSLSVWVTDRGECAP